jgi:hypothetical protein
MPGLQINKRKRAEHYFLRPNASSHLKKGEFPTTARNNIKVSLPSVGKLEHISLLYEALGLIFTLAR